jgi:endonuclease/exonuclease/phosphatase family metal-dependent hydrolase
MKIASYNIRKAVGLDWKRDPERILETLAEINADIVVLQEADKRLGTRPGVLSVERLETQLGYVVANVGTGPDSHGWHGNAILLRNKISVLKTTRIKLPAIEPRGAVSVRLADYPLEIIGVHLGLTPGMRRKQILALKQHILKTDTATLIAGDLNEWKRHSGFARILGPEFDEVTPGNSYHASRPTAPLDRFILQKPLQYRSCTVHHSQLAKMASDHLPVEIDLEI